MISRSSPFLVALRLTHTQLGFLALIFVGSTFMFSITDRGITFILWEHRPAIGIFLVAIGAVLALGWIVGRKSTGTSRLKVEAETRADRRRQFRESPYNIFGEMEPRVRRRLAIAVFFTFSVLGPVGLLMGNFDLPVPWPVFVLMTFSSGAMSGSFVLFGHRRVVLVLSFTFWLLVNANAAGIISTLFGPSAIAVSIPDAAARARAVAESRSVIGIAAIILLAIGYVLWIVVITKEGSRRRRYQAEIEVAQRIQQRLIPSGILRTSWLEAAGITVSATDVGGDFFDFIPIDDTHVAFVVADVAGHGIGPGILAAMLKSALHSQVMHDPSPVPVLENLNATIQQVADRNMFVTLAYVLLDNARSVARIATAGHPPVCVLKKGGTLEEVRSRSLGLGMQRDGRFTEVEISVEGGDRLFLYTDGVTEAADDLGAQFDLSRLHSSLHETSRFGAKECSQTVIDSVHRFMGSDEFRDDATVVCIRLLSPQT